MTISSESELAGMRRVGRLVARTIAHMRAELRPGITTGELDASAERFARAEGAPSAPQLTYDFPGFTCISVNEEVVHGIPGRRVLKDGDVVTLDVALSLDGFCCDTASTVGVGKIAALQQKLLDVTKQTLVLAIEHIKPGKRWSEIARLMQYNVERNGFSVVREFVGHGIGRQMHEDPKVPNFVTGEQLRGDFRLKPGMTIAVEPMVVAGRRDVNVLPDQWTMVTEDGMPAAHYEHTIAVTEHGVDVLTDGRAPFSL